VTTFINVEFGVDLRPSNEWRPEMRGDKNRIIGRMQQVFSKYPGVVFGFSQTIQDNVEEAMSGVKGENSMKLFGDDLSQLTRFADQIQGVMSQVRRVADAGVLKVNGHPSMVIAVNRAKAARYGIAPADINAVIQAAVGGSAITQMVEGDRRFGITVRYPEANRSNPEQVNGILLQAPDGGRVPLSEVAEVSIREGSFMIYREGGRALHPYKIQRAGPRSCRDDR